MTATSRSLRLAGAASLALLVLLHTPQTIIQAGGGARLDSEYGISLAIGAGVLVAVGLGYRMLSRIVPRTADHQLVARYISEPFSAITAAAKLISYVMIVAIAAGFAVSSLTPLIGPTSTVLPLIQAAAVLIFAVPTMIGRQPSARVIIGALAPAALAIAVIIVGGLVIELAGGLTTIPETTVAEPTAGIPWPLGEAVLGALFPAAVLGLATERSFGETGGRRITSRRLLTAILPVLVAIAALLYLSHITHLPPATTSPSVLALAEVFFPGIVVTIIGVAFAVAGAAVALATFIQVSQLIRQLAADGILPRHIAAADAYGARRAVVATLAGAGAVAVVLARSPLGGATIVVTIMSVSMLLTMSALVVRSRTIRRQSTELTERVDAGKSRIAGLLLGAIATAILALSVSVEPHFTLVGALALAIPSIALLVLRRGMGRVGATLAADDLSAGRSLPTRVHAIVLVERLDRPTLQAITFVRATRPSTMTGLVVDVDPVATDRLTKDWMAADLPVELTILGTPRGAARRPVIEHVQSLRRSSPRDIVIIYSPRVVSSSAPWQRFFVSHSTPALLSELKLEPGVIVAEVPYQIEDIEEQ
ncbi:APC family permease [Flaviflexus huanghaiensis]|uniref:APC family permease n=1 Tax=Flaviflexus huanghaiensis TaxID=1111473 RepID=UPI0015FB2F45|nr:APC family permease [Flaviflexus huanghaiensis]